jgi:hypothetical protein
MKFRHDNGSQIIFGDYSIKVNYLQSFFSTPTLSLLRVENILFSPIINTDSISTDNADSLDLDFPSKFNFIIQNISLGGVVEIPVNNVIKTLKLKLNSRLDVTPEKKEFYIDEFSAAFNDTSGYVLLRNTPLIINETSAHFSPASGVVNGLPFDGEIHYDWTLLPDLSGNIHIERYEFP